MDPNYNAQDLARCDLCKNAIAQSYCDFCHVNLCKPCIGEHISDGNEKHIIVSFKQRLSNLIYPKCETHQNEDSKYQCKDCNTFVCSRCTDYSRHSGHTLLKLGELFHISKRHVQNDREELDNRIMPAYEDISIDLEHEMASVDDQYEKLTTELSRQKREIHREVDNTIHQMEMEIGEMRLKHHSILKKHLDEVKELLCLLQQTRLSLNELEGSNRFLQIFHYSSKIQEFCKIPSKVQISMPKFIPKQIKRDELCCLIGKLTSVSPTLEERVLRAEKPNTSVRELLDEPEVLNTVRTGNVRLRSVMCLNEKTIFTCGEMSPVINRFNIEGVLQRTFITKSRIVPGDIAIDKNGALLYTDWITKTVCKVKNDQTDGIIKLEGWTPLNLCVTSSDDLLVTVFSDDLTQSKVVRYSGSALNQIIQFDDEGQPLYSGNCSIKHISEKRNLDICVADCGAGAVVVVNQAGKLRFRYKGHPLLTKNMPFEPRGITTDSQSRILTSDCKNHCIHILDTDGQFLRFIDNCGLDYPRGLCVSSDDLLIVCEFLTCNVKKIRYSV